MTVKEIEAGARKLTGLLLLHEAVNHSFLPITLFNYFC
jgi:hypothetical protein